MTSEHLNKKSQNENFEETTLTREKNMVNNALDKENLLKESFKRGYQEGRHEGHRKGFQEGYPEGFGENFKEGFKEGFKEDRKKSQQAIVLKMIELNYSLLEITKITKCPENEIKKLMK